MGRQPGKYAFTDLTSDYEPDKDPVRPKLVLLCTAREPRIGSTAQPSSRSLEVCVCILILCE